LFTIGSYLATRLSQIGLKHYFIVPGDYNLLLLDQLETHPGMQQINCTNELNASFAAEGYARATGAGACVVTYSVGGISALNGIGGAYAENLPVILISGAPNTNDVGARHLLHHTLGKPDYFYQLGIAKYLTCEAVRITSSDDAPYMIDRAIRSALREHKPVYIEIPCNLATAPCAFPGPISSLLQTIPSDPATLLVAVSAASAFLASRARPMLLAGPKLRAAGAQEAFLKLAEALGCAVAVMLSAKGLFPEDHPQFAGIALGEVSTHGCNELIDWADGVLCAGTVFTDYSTVGWTSQLAANQIIDAGFDRIKIPGYDFDNIRLADFLFALADKVAPNPATMVQFARFQALMVPPKDSATEGKLTRHDVFLQVQELLSAESTLLVETGDSWFNGMYMTLPHGTGFEIEMQWGHIGWSIPASFGYALGAPLRQIIVMVGDGAFQITAQEVAQMILHKLPVIIFLMNNRGYTIEVEIHDGSYNNIKNWDYAGLMDVFNAESGTGKGLLVNTAEELKVAIIEAKQNTQGPTLIECTIDRDDCTRQLISWGQRVATANARPPVI
jgi:pyruvate decarboxylase